MVLEITNLRALPILAMLSLRGLNALSQYINVL